MYYAGYCKILWNSDQNVLQGARCCSFSRHLRRVQRRVDIETLDLIEGDLPQRALRIVKDWAKQYQSELLRMWKEKDFKKLPGLE